MLKQQSFLDFARGHLLILISFLVKKRKKKKHIVFLDIQNSNSSKKVKPSLEIYSKYIRALFYPHLVSSQCPAFVFVLLPPCLLPF